MPNNTLILRVRKLTPEQLDAELASPEHNDIGRQIILQEKTRRAVVEAARPHWLVRAGFAVAVLAAVCAGISALPEIRSWFRATAAGQSTSVPAFAPVAPQPLAAPAASKPDYGSQPTEACRKAIEEHYRRVFGPNLAFQFDEATEAAIEDPAKPGQRIHGWMFEARWNFKPPAKSNFPMAARFLARSDSVILTAPIGGPFERWETKIAKDEGTRQ